jgi:hypothetical protein
LQFKVDRFQHRCAIERFPDFLQSKQRGQGGWTAL